MFKNFRPLGNRILIEREVLSELKTESGLITNVDPVAGEMPPIGTVIAVGPGSYQNGILIPIDLSIGDKIYFMRHSDTLLDDTYSVLAENAVLGVIE